MRKTGRCILSAVIAVLLMIGAIDYAFVIGKAKPVGDLKTSQSEVIVKDFIHDNYEIRFIMKKTAMPRCIRQAQLSL